MSVEKKSLYAYSLSDKISLKENTPTLQILSTLEECTDEFLLYLETVRGFSRNTVTGYSEDLKHLSLIIDDKSCIKQITAEDLRSCIGALSRRKYSSASINRFIAAVRGLFAYCKKNGYIDINVALELKTVKLPKHLPRFMTEGEVDELCNAPQKKDILWKTRDHALFEMLYSSGCRVSEITSLKLQDFSEDFSSAIVTGKGNKDRRVFFEHDAVIALKEYICERSVKFPLAGKNKAKQVDNVFINQQGKPLTTQGVWYIIARYSGSEGTNRHMSPHAFRHTFATTMLKEGADVRVVQELLGHSSISTTQRYTHISKEHLKKIYEQSFPHSGRKD